MSLKIKSVPAKWNDNYKKGYVGFAYHNREFVSEGIAMFENWVRKGDIKVSHAFLVTGENECIEAIGKGVRKGSLKDYFNDPNCQVFFRVPFGLNEDIAARLDAKARPQIGKGYDYGMVFGNAMGIVADFVESLLTGTFSDKHKRLESIYLNDGDRWACSELVAYCLDEQPEYRNKGILNLPNATITPQELFEDGTIFERWT